MKVFSNSSCGCIISDDTNTLFVKYYLAYACSIYQNMWAGFANLFDWHAEHVVILKFRALSNPGGPASGRLLVPVCLTQWLNVSMTQWLTDSLTHSPPGFWRRGAYCCSVMRRETLATQVFFWWARGPWEKRKSRGERHGRPPKRTRPPPPVTLTWGNTEEMTPLFSFCLSVCVFMWDCFFIGRRSQEIILRVIFSETPNDPIDLDFNKNSWILCRRYSF